MMEHFERLLVEFEDCEGRSASTIHGPKDMTEGQAVELKTNAFVMEVLPVEVQIGPDPDPRLPFAGDVFRSLRLRFRCEARQTGTSRSGGDAAAAPPPSPPSAAREGGQRPASAASGTAPPRSPWSHPQVVAACIAAGATLLAAVIVAAVAWYTGQSRPSTAKPPAGVAAPVARPAPQTQPSASLRVWETPEGATGLWGASTRVLAFPEPKV